MLSNLDTLGRKVEQTYSRIITDPTFENRLRAFDPKLKLMFDQGTKKWTILEWAYDNSGWNIILVAEDSKGEAKPLGEWVFNKLYVWRKKWEEKAQVGADKFLDNLIVEAAVQKEQMRQAASDDHQAMLKDDIIQWRKVSKELNNQPVNDATAGYRKI